MQIFLYNTASRKKEVFKPINDKEVKIYSCGPTVYSRQHIGNLRAVIFTDILKKTLRFAGYDVKDVLNITDVGHLVSDGDEGEDKMLKASKKEKKDPYEIAKMYENFYKQDIEKLNVKMPSVMPRATEHIKEQLDIISKLEEKGMTYQLEDGIYFDTSKFEEYGFLSKQKLEEKKAGARVDVKDEKRNPQDFALWKFTTGDNKNHIMKWDSPWGEGFPGWHLECSAMSSKYLGEEFDIHTGGVDHISIHHENEIAQNTCSGCVKKVNFWIHNEFVKVEGEKMSKSLGNVYTLQEILDKGFSPLAFRELCLRSHYRKQINFTFESLKAGEINVEKFNDFYIRIEQIKTTDKEDEVSKMLEDALNEFSKAIFDDLNTPEALAVVHEVQTEINKQKEFSGKEKQTILDFMNKVDSVLGLLYLEEKVPVEVEELAEKRKEARNSKDFAKADSLRDEIESLGWEIKDSKDVERGYLLSKKK